MHISDSEDIAERQFHVSLKDSDFLGRLIPGSIFDVGSRDRRQIEYEVIAAAVEVVEQIPVHVLHHEPLSGLCVLAVQTGVEVRGQRCAVADDGVDRIRNGVFKVLLVLPRTVLFPDALHGTMGLDVVAYPLRYDLDILMTLLQERVDVSSKGGFSATGRSDKGDFS